MGAVTILQQVPEFPLKAYIISRHLKLNLPILESISPGIQEQQLAKKII